MLVRLAWNPSNVQELTKRPHPQLDFTAGVPLTIQWHFRIPSPSLECGHWLAILVEGYCSSLQINYPTCDSTQVNRADGDDVVGSPSWATMVQCGTPQTARKCRVTCVRPRRHRAPCRLGCGRAAAPSVQVVALSSLHGTYARAVSLSTRIHPSPLSPHCHHIYHIRRHHIHPIDLQYTTD
jgi:hypothetical protein